MFRVHFGYVPGGFRGMPLVGWISGGFRVHFGWISGSFRGIREKFGHISGKFGYISGIFRAKSVVMVRDGTGCTG